MESDPPEGNAVACLWKCLVLTERFEQANALVEEYETLVKLIPAQVIVLVANIPSPYPIGGGSIIFQLLIGYSTL